MGKLPRHDCGHAKIMRDGLTGLSIFIVLLWFKPVVLNLPTSTFEIVFWLGLSVATVLIISARRSLFYEPMAALLETLDNYYCWLYEDWISFGSDARDRSETTKSVSEFFDRWVLYSFVFIYAMIMADRVRAKPSHMAAALCSTVILLAAKEWLRTVQSQDLPALLVQKLCGAFACIILLVPILIQSRPDYHWTVVQLAGIGGIALGIFHAKAAITHPARGSNGAAR